MKKKEENLNSAGEDNSTNINKTNNRFSFQTIEHRMRTTTYGVWNTSSVLGQAEQCGYSH